MSRNALGDLEHQVLLAALRLKDEAYSVSVVLEIEERTHHTPSQSAVFIALSIDCHAPDLVDALRRLEEKGLLRSHLEENSPESGRARRYFRITPAGMDRLRDMRASILGLWDGIAAELDGAR